MLGSIFHTAKDDFGSAEGDSASDWIVFRVGAVTDPKLDANSPDAKRIDDVVQRQETNDLMSEYMAWLENDLGTSVNQTALAQAVGSGAPAEPDTD
jgi:peptidyl-prolyl cis-trans isomerase D